MIPSNRLKILVQLTESCGHQSSTINETDTTRAGNRQAERTTSTHARIRPAQQWIHPPVKRLSPTTARMGSKCGHQLAHHRIQIDDKRPTTTRNQPEQDTPAIPPQLRRVGTDSGWIPANLQTKMILSIHLPSSPHDSNETSIDQLRIWYRLAHRSDLNRILKRMLRSRFRAIPSSCHHHHPFDWRPSLTAMAIPWKLGPVGPTGHFARQCRFQLAMSVSARLPLPPGVLRNHQRRPQMAPLVTRHRPSLNESRQEHQHRQGPEICIEAALHCVNIPLPPVPLDNNNKKNKQNDNNHSQNKFSWLPIIGRWCASVATHQKCDESADWITTAIGRWLSYHLPIPAPNWPIWPAFHTASHRSFDWLVKVELNRNRLQPKLRTATFTRLVENGCIISDSVLIKQINFGFNFSFFCGLRGHHSSTFISIYWFSDGFVCARFHISNRSLGIDLNLFVHCWRFAAVWQWRR